MLREEGRPPETLFDFVQGITAMARTKTHQDARLELKGRAKTLLDCAASHLGAVQLGSGCMALRRNAAPSSSTSPSPQGSPAGS